MRKEAVPGAQGNETNPATITEANVQAIETVNAEAAAKVEKQQEFHQLVARKEALWASISDNTLYELSPEWKEIQTIDDRLNQLWERGNGGVTRKEGN